jgi:NADPH:quinone reductase-like Zn-dependent oxidoreductase
MMQAIVQHAYGASDVLRLHDIDAPTPGPHDVLVRVHAASINHGDGFVTSGRVETVGAAVTRFRPGDDVYAEATTGSLAEYACVPERLLARKPTNLTFAQAAAVPVAAVTALQGLRDTGEAQPGQAVLINGASKGAGTFAVQIAKTLGADVTGACSTRNVALVRSLGADHVIDYTREDFTRSGQRYDLLFDLAGPHPLAACRRALTRTGTTVWRAATAVRCSGRSAATSRRSPGRRSCPSDCACTPRNRPNRTSRRSPRTPKPKRSPP